MGPTPHRIYVHHHVLRAPDGNHVGSFKLLKSALLLCAAAAFFFGGFAVFELGSFLRTAVSAEGTVVRLDWRVDMRRVRPSSGYQAVVRFRKADGGTHEFVDDSGSDPPRYSIGEKVRVLYDPADPRNAKIDSFRSLWLAPVLALFAGVLILGIFAAIRVRPDRVAGVAAWLHAREKWLRARFASARAEESAGSPARHDMDASLVPQTESPDAADKPAPEAGRSASAAGALRSLTGRTALAPGFKSRIAYYAPAWCWPFLLLFIAQASGPVGSGAGLDSGTSLAVFFLCNIPAVYGWLKGRLPWTEMVIAWWIAPFLIWAALVLQT